MFRYSTSYINLVSFIISIIIFLILNIFLSNYNILKPVTVFRAGFQVENQNIQVNKIEESESKDKNETQEISEDWYLEIPSINLKANIKEGTTKEIMEDFIGHFEETKKEAGNIGLAAHNRGYKNNYFEHLKELKEGDIIYYKYKNIKKEYIVTNQSIIKDTDWSILEDTEENMITLITCVENQPEYRRCIQGKEFIKESEEI